MPITTGLGTQSLTKIVHYTKGNIWSAHSPLSRSGHPVTPVQTSSHHRLQQLVGVVTALSQQLYHLAENK